MRDFFVVSAPAADGERFAILWRDKFPVGPFLWSSSTEDWLCAFDRYLHTATLIEEEEVRAQLAEMGLPSDDVDEQIQRARDMRACNEETTWESTTRIGFRNGQRQEVIRKTVRAGTLPFQRVYVLHCGDCGHEYGANGSEVHARRCPQCQAGSPGLIISDTE
jgi:hypothetical protein